MQIDLFLQMHTFDEDFRLRFSKALQLHVNELAEASLIYVQEAGGFSDCAIQNISPKEAHHPIDRDICVDFMLDARRDMQDVKFGFKINGGLRLRENEIQFPFLNRLPPIPPFGTTAFDQYRHWRDELEYACEAAFWHVEDNIMRYRPFVELNVFDDKNIESSKLDYYKFHSIVVAKDRWLAFIRDLIKILFAEFIFSEKYSAGKVKRFLQEVGNGVFFGFEYDESDLSYEIKQGNPVLPDYFNLILLNADFKKGEKRTNYYKEKNASVISLGKLWNPFFYHPCYPMRGFVAIDSHKAYEEGRPYKTQIVPAGPNEMKLVHSQERNESVKKHAFFYMSLLSSTAASYVKYLKTAIQTAL